MDTSNPTLNSIALPDPLPESATSDAVNTHVIATTAAQQINDFRAYLKSKDAAAQPPKLFVASISPCFILSDCRTCD
jgi:hypothetical protein